MLYRSAAKSVLTELDGVQARALRICLGAIRTPPVCVLQGETGEMPLDTKGTTGSQLLD